MHQKIAESGMIANQATDAIDWEIIPDLSSHDDSMDIDPQLDKWDDICEEKMGPDRKAVARLQTIILYASPLSRTESTTSRIQRIPSPSPPKATSKLKYSHVVESTLRPRDPGKVSHDLPRDWSST